MLRRKLEKEIIMTSRQDKVVFLHISKILILSLLLEAMFGEITPTMKQDILYQHIIFNPRDRSTVGQDHWITEKWEAMF